MSKAPPKLVKLPPLPRRRGGGDRPNKLPKLPGLPRPPKQRDDGPTPWRPDLTDEVDVASDNFDERKISGKDAPGRWWETGRAEGSIGGTCWNCGRKRKAENLRLHQRPFGKGEVWICKEGC